MPDDDGFPCEGDVDYCPKSPAPASDPWHSWQWLEGGRCQWCGAEAAADLPVPPERCGVPAFEDALSTDGAECVLALDHDGPCIPDGER